MAFGDHSIQKSYETSSHINSQAFLIMNKQAHQSIPLINLQSIMKLTLEWNLGTGTLSEQYRRFFKGQLEAKLRLETP